MDWFSWLSGTSLEPVLVYEYGLVLERNELTAEDVAYFDHEFLQSMGIAVAKHRLEILKLARKEKGGALRGQSGPLSGVWTGITRTRKSLGKYFSGLVSSEEDGSKAPLRDNVRIPRTKDKDGMDVRDQIMVFRRKNKLAFSGRLVDSRVQDRFLITSTTTSNPKSTQWSGPLYPPPKSPVLPIPPLYPARSPKLSGLVLHPTRTPIVSAPLHRMAPSPGPKVVYGDDVDDDDFNAHSLWAQLFHDMKPT
ncbi:hypothetical protein MLD38_005681 [Melastoma candidum]|uniref:Uncharacterized protein n=1 Tax=Melastoma candidum TaxID=119954 RepID=A0ACB9RNH5_9MYRT|nr:hypothetical protein MLD38_005681 [Melastoma candidum]